MGNNIKGITIELGGNTGPLTSALKDVNKTAGDLQSELREVNKQLKFDPKNTVLATQKLDLLKQSAQTLEEKQKTLKTAVEQAHAAFEKGDMGAEKVRAVEREYEKVNSQLKETKKDLAAAEAESGSFTEKVKGKFSQLKDKIKDTFSPDTVKSGIGAVGVAVGTFLKSSVDEAKDAEKVNADLEQTLKSTKGAAGMTMDSLNDLTQAMVSNTTFTDDEVKSGEGMLLTFTNIGKTVFPQATAALLDMSQKMGTDTKTQAVQLGKALNDPLKGVTALTKVGVTFTDQQKKQIEAMEKAGNTAGAQKVILAELNKEFGGQATAAAKGFNGQQKQTANILKEVKETIGTALIPALAALLKPIAPILQAIGNFVSKNPQLTAAILVVIAIIGTLVGGLSLLTTVTGAFGITLDVAVLPTIGLVVLAIAALAAGAVLVVTHWQQISGFFIGLWNGIKGVFSGIGGWFGSVFDSAKQAIVNNFSPSALSDHFNGVWKSVRDTFSKLNPVEWGKDLINGIASGIKSAAYHVRDAVGNVASTIRSFLHFSRPDTGDLRDYESWMPDFMGGLANGIRNSTAPVIRAAKGVASGIAANIKIPGTVTTGLQLRTALAAVGGYSQVSNVNQQETKKVTQNFYGDIKAAGTGEKNSTLQQLQFIAGV